MRTQRVVTELGFLSLIAAAGIFAVSMGFAANTPEATNTILAKMDDLKVKAIDGPRWLVADSHGNTYVLENTTGRDREGCDRSRFYTPNMSH